MDKWPNESWFKSLDLIIKENSNLNAYVKYREIKAKKEEANQWRDMFDKEREELTAQIQKKDSIILNLRAKRRGKR